MLVSRRTLLAGAASSLAASAWADAPLTSPRPLVRVDGLGVTARMIARAGMSGKVGFVIADAATGDVLDKADADLPQPPASVTKAITALYGIEVLGAQHQFETRIIADGVLKDGILHGNLILAGGGDPNLVTDQLADLADRLRASGLKRVTGDFLVWDDALVNLDEIDSSQMDHLGYNPTITGLNLNFNRVHFEWQRSGETYVTALDARSENHRPPVTMARMRIVDRRSPVFTYRDAAGVDEWTVARRALNQHGSRWLPVRYPARYAGEVFATFARSRGIALAPPQEVNALPDGALLATYQSAPLGQMMGAMMRFSTNITAEATGLTATAALAGQQRGLRTSALGMARWAARRAGVGAYFVDHSGLGDRSRISAFDMVKLLTARGVAPVLRPLMKRVDIVDRNRRVIPDHPGQILAKTGTLNFVSSLAGYMRDAKGRDLAFAFFAADLDARDRGKIAGGEAPPGARRWNRDAIALQQRILQHWIAKGGR